MIAVVTQRPAEQRINNDFNNNYAFTRHGVKVVVVAGRENVPIFSKTVWDRPIWAKRYFRSYPKRLHKTLGKAQKIVDALGGRK